MGVVILSMNEDPEVLRFPLRLIKQQINLRIQFMSYVCLDKQLDNDIEEKRFLVMPLLNPASKTSQNALLSFWDFENLSNPEKSLSVHMSVCPSRQVPTKESLKQDRRKKYWWGLNIKALEYL